MRMPRLLTAAVLPTLALVSSIAAQTVIPVRPFRSVELQNGGHVTLRHGPAQRVTMLSGSLQDTEVRVESDGRLVIDHHGRGHSRQQRLQIEIVTPQLTAVSVSNGGTITAAGAFPAQAAIDAAVEQGGRVDIRSIPADIINASVYSGGGIFIQPRQALKAAVASGGIITYWGDPRVTRSVRGGGVVTRGNPADFDKPLDMGPQPPQPIPPVPPVPPVNANQ